MGKKNKNLEDLIGTSGAAPIVVQQEGGDKKLLYILLIVLLVLFLLAIGLIAFLGGKFLNQNKDGSVLSRVNAPTTMQTKSVEHGGSNSSSVSSKEVSDLEKMAAQEEVHKRIQAAVAKQSAKENMIKKTAEAATGKKLSKEELEKIAMLVSKELSKEKNEGAKASKDAGSNTKASSSEDDAALAAQLENMQTDTLSNSQTQSTKLKENVKVSNKKKVDTFNKVVVSDKNKNGDDEVAKLSQEIDAILQSDDVKEVAKKDKFTDIVAKEAKQRAQEMRFIVVKKGDTLGSIANRAYGRASAYVKIYKANPDIVRNPNRIYIGMKLRVPIDKEYKKQRQGK